MDYAPAAGADLPLGKKGLSLRAPDFGVPKFFRVRIISRISITNYLYFLVKRTFFNYAADKRSLYSRGDGQIYSIEESLAENHKQRAAKADCSVKCSSKNNAGFA